MLTSLQTPAIKMFPTSNAHCFKHMLLIIILTLKKFWNMWRKLHFNMLRKRYQKNIRQACGRNRITRRKRQKNSKFENGENNRTTQR